MPTQVTRQTIRRCADGSIDTDVYVAEGLECRSQAGRGAMASLTRALRQAVMRWNAIKPANSTG